MLVKEMFSNRNFLVLFFAFFFMGAANSSIKESVLNSLINTQNLNFNFEQNINGKIETGNCTIEYPKKIFCKYNLANEKILVSNGRSIVIKTKSGSYYRYPIEKTLLGYILDKQFIINEINNSNERIIDDKFVNFKLFQNENEINIFFDKKNYNLIGWQVIDLYQNLNITFLSSIKKNQTIKKNLFKLPSTN